MHASEPTAATGFVDTHCHLDSILKRMQLPDFIALDEKHLGPDCEACLTVSCDPHSIQPVLDLLLQPKVYAAFGIHPHDSQKWTDDLRDEILVAVQHPKCVAYGEIGLDYHYEYSPRDVQKENFRLQLELGLSTGKPLVIHTREAEEDTLQALKDCVPPEWKVHVHCFTSSQKLAEQLLETFSNLYIGFTGIVTFKNSHELQALAKIIPEQRFVLETDGPYLAPLPHRGQVAHPGHIPIIAQKMAELKGISTPMLLRYARENSRRLYGI
jgi:TatD DNase family protein